MPTGRPLLFGACVSAAMAVAVILATASVHAGSASLNWSSLRDPSDQPPQAIGGYSRGCLAGGRALALRSSSWAVAKPSRDRMYGHPELLAFVRDYAKALTDHGLGPLIVGDLGQARGGPAPSGHKSHQTGLDVDLWYGVPEQLGSVAKLPVAALEKTPAPDLVASDGSAPVTFEPVIDDRLRRAALDRRVDRLFVHPRIKERLCERAGKDRQWLQKVRPWWGHSAHFHVRLRCPSDSPSCENQAPLPAGDGCSELAWWFAPQAQAERDAGREAYRHDMGKAAVMPAQCDDVRRARAQTQTK